MSDLDPAAFFAAERPTEAALRLLRAERAPELVEALLAELAGEASWRRQRALERVAEIDDPRPLLDPLAHALRDAASAERRNSARSALAALAAPTAAAPAAALQRLGALMGDEDPDVRVLAVSALGECGHSAARAPLERALGDEDPNVAAAAADSLGMLGDPRALDALLGAAESGPFWVRVAVVVALGRLGEPRAVPALAQAAAEPWLAAAAAHAMGEIGDPAALPALRVAAALGGEARSEALSAAARVLGLHPALEAPAWLREEARGAEPALAERLRETPDAGVARLLGLAGTPTAADRLLERLATPGYDAAAAIGIAALPHDVATMAIGERLRAVSPRERTLLLGSLPPLADAVAVAAVARYLSDPAEEVRAAAADTLARSDDAHTLPVLEDLVERPETRLGAVLAYSRLGHARCGPLDRLLEDPDARVRAAAAEGLARCGPAYEQGLRAALRREDDPSARQALARALGVVGGDEAVRELAALLRDEDASLRFTAARALGRTGSPLALEPLLGALVDPRPEVQAAALDALGALGDPRAVPRLAAHLDDSDRDLRRTAAFALDRMTPAGAVERLLTALDDPDREVRLAAVRALWHVGDPQALDDLERVADHDRDSIVRQAACRALEELRTRREPGGR